MAKLTVNNLPEDVLGALKKLAVRHGQSTEAEVREMLAMAVKPAGCFRMGDALAELMRKISLTREDFEVLDQVKNIMPAEPLSFE